MKILRLVGLFFVWSLIMLLVGVTWITWSIQKLVILVALKLNDRFFETDATELERFL